MNLVQVSDGRTRRVGIVEGETITFLADCSSVYDLATDAIVRGEPLSQLADARRSAEQEPYDAIYRGASRWKLLPSFDHPRDAAHCMVSGTGLTHKASAENRAAMHKAAQKEVTDSARMYQMGLEAGSPPPGEIGVQPEWFFKGDGSMLRAHGDPLLVPSYADDGGEEPEIAGAYLIAPSGDVRRVGLTMANEFSDHRMERVNYLYLAPSKLRTCAIGPELVVSETDFADVAGSVSVLRNGETLWSKEIRSGQKNMSHTLANLEHHHFKYPAHRRPGDAHVHFFGADAFSFGEGVLLEPGDVMEIAFAGFGRPLRNVLKRDEVQNRLISVRPL